MVSVIRISLSIVALALLYPFVAERARVVRLLVDNAPHKITEVNTFADSSIKFADRLRNCEDGLMIDEDHVAIFSCDAGRDVWNTVMGTFTPELSTVPHGNLHLYRYGQKTASDEEAKLTTIELRDFAGIKDFHPLGIEYHRPTSTLYVCNHSFNGSRIEVFSLDFSDSSKNPVATHQSTIISPLIKSPNAIAVLSDHELYVTSDHYFLQRYNPVLSWLETYLGLPLGGVFYVNLLTNEIRTVARVPFSNGITLLNETTVVVASSSTAAVRFYEMSSDRSLKQAGAVNVDFMPDNLSTDKNGVLLITGHPHPPTLDKMRLERFECLMNSAVGNLDCVDGKAPFWVAEWSADAGVKTLFTSKDRLAGGCTSLRDTEYNVGITLGLYGKGAFVWKQ
ncbi:Serum paraoxonase/lactonase 3 [Talaromyces pinophilus]|nr:Serum paraoxonase/lactonase 3 [Talaromyces pinophilus]